MTSYFCMASGPITSWQTDGETMETVTGFIFLGSKISVDGDFSHEIKRLAPWKKNYDKSRQHQKQRHYFANKGLSSHSYGFSSSHVWMWELDYKEGWVPKNWCFWTVVLVKTLESPLDSKMIKPVNPKGNQPKIFIGRTEAEAPVLWPPDLKSWLIRKEPEVEKGTTEDKMVGGHHQLNGHEFEQALGDDEGQGSLACRSPWGCKELDMTATEQQMRSETSCIWSTNQYALVGGSSPESQCLTMLLGYLPIWCLSPTSSSPIGEAKLVLDLLSVCA